MKIGKIIAPILAIFIAWALFHTDLFSNTYTWIVETWPQKILDMWQQVVDYINALIALLESWQQ